MESTSLLLPSTPESSTPLPVRMITMKIVERDRVPRDTRPLYFMEGIHMQVLCSDIDHNHRTESYSVTVSVACDCELQLPMLPRSMRAFPRYIVDLKPTRDGPGRWVNILSKMTVSFVFSHPITHICLDTFKDFAQFAQSHKCNVTV